MIWYGLQSYKETNAMNKIVRENYPASKLPEDLRDGLDSKATVTVIVTEEALPDRVLTLEKIFALRKPPYRTKKQIDASIRRQRDEWDG